jgi:hypothetical protein
MKKYQRMGFWYIKHGLKNWKIIQQLCNQRFFDWFEMPRINGYSIFIFSHKKLELVVLWFEIFWNLELMVINKKKNLPNIGLVDKEPMATKVSLFLYFLLPCFYIFLKTFFNFFENHPTTHDLPPFLPSFSLTYIWSKGLHRSKTLHTCLPLVSFSFSYHVSFSK